MYNAKVAEVAELKTTAAAVNNQIKDLMKTFELKLKEQKANWDTSELKYQANIKEGKVKIQDMLK